ncbi:MAG: hypothetical protein M3O23_00385 [Actinomycetota bacterium]|nr:hypothetical protein [Actinomycetota bacterium]
MRTRSGPRNGNRLVTIAVALWAVVWLVTGVVTGLQIRNLTEVSDSIVESGRALDAAGAALQDIGRLPVVGERPRQLGEQVRRTAGEIHQAGMSSRETVRWVSVLLGAALVLIPVVPIVAVYVPLRTARNRNRRALARGLSAPVPDPVLEQFLAHRAVQNLPYDALLQVSSDPWGDLQRGSYRRLANAELTRLGLANRRTSTQTRSGTSTGPAGRTG